VNPFLSRELAGEHVRDLRQEAVRAVRGGRKQESDSSDWSARLTVRRFANSDIEAIRRLAELDGKPTPIGGVLVAEVAEELVAAVPVDGGEALADPFKPTADIVALLRLRARQLRESSGARRSPLSLASRLAAPLRRLA
jgi:hypothetical protein